MRTYRKTSKDMDYWDSDTDDDIDNRDAANQVHVTPCVRLCKHIYCICMCVCVCTFMRVYIVCI